MGRSQKFLFILTMIFALIFPCIFANPTDFFWDGANNLYRAIKSNEARYSHMVLNKVPDKDFSDGFRKCSGGTQFVTTKSLEACLEIREDVKRNSAKYHDFLDAHWSQIDGDEDGKLNFAEWKLFVFSFSYAHSLMVFGGFDADGNNELDLEEKATFMQYFKNWLTKNGDVEMIKHIESFIVDSEIGNNPDKIGFIECIRILVQVFNKLLLKVQ